MIRQTLARHPHLTSTRLLFPQVRQDFPAVAAYNANHVRNTIKRVLAEAPAGAAPIPIPAPEPSPEEVLLGDRRARRLEGELRDLKRRYKHAVHELDLSEQRFEVALNIRQPCPEIRIEARLPAGQGEATAIALYSDWHIEERVDLQQLNGLNEYNPQIAEQRAITCFQNTLRLVQKERAAVQIDEMVLWLGGYFITGFIHEELSQTNWLSPTEATRLAKKLLYNGIRFLLDHGKFRRVRAICNPGNHGRTTAKMQIANSHKMSYEWMMYHDLADLFKDDARIEFDIPTSPFGYIQVYDKVIRTFHGEGIKYGGGIGGVAIPLIKHVHRLNKQRPADLNVLGHFHQSIRPAKDIIMNGSLIGFSPYAQKIGCDPENPQQMFLLCDKDRGFTVSCPIHV